jgi:hypothetical protein
VRLVREEGLIEAEQEPTDEEVRRYDKVNGSPARIHVEEGMGRPEQPADLGSRCGSYYAYRDHQGPRAVLNALERLASGYGSECVRAQRDLDLASSQLRDYQDRLGQPFSHDRYVSELTGLRDELKAGLSATAQEPSKADGLSVSELSERIRALKAAHTVEGTPQRAGKREASAEEPIMARIRRRQEVNPASEQVLGDRGHQDAGRSSPTQAVPYPAKRPDVSFRERIAMERYGKDPQPSLP